MINTDTQPTSEFNKKIIYFSIGSVIVNIIILILSFASFNMAKTQAYSVTLNTLQKQVYIQNQIQDLANNQKNITNSIVEMVKQSNKEISNAFNVLIKENQLNFPQPQSKTTPANPNTIGE